MSLTGIAFLLLCPAFALSQYTQDLLDLKKAEELYDARGFAHSSAINVDGKLNVSNAGGNVAYSYPIANYTKGGFPIRVELNYCGSVAF